MSAEDSGNTSPVPNVNNGPHPESNVTATPGKRKRSEQDEKATSEATTSLSQNQTTLHENLRSLVDLLSK